MSSVKKISDGTIHQVPKDLKKAIISSSDVLIAWEDITPLARNEWICWVTSAKKEETRKGRIKRLLENLAEGKRRPCCWAGCPHR